MLKRISIDIYLLQHWQQTNDEGKNVQSEKQEEEKD